MAITSKSSSAPAYFIDRGSRHDVVNLTDNLVLQRTANGYVREGRFVTELLTLPPGCGRNVALNKQAATFWYCGIRSARIKGKLSLLAAAMHNEKLHLWQHEHSFGQHEKRPGEIRTIIVIAITATMMVVEIVAGIAFGSMALLADGLHMASHATALSISAFAYIYARRHAHDKRYSFGMGKVNSLGGFTGAVLLAVFALMMGWESVERIIYPVDIAFNQAIFVAFLGLVVNGASVLILGHKHEHDHAHDTHEHNHRHEHDHHHDHNLQAAYLHVLADALTSVLAIFALLAGKYYGLIWMDPLMGIVGAILVARWSMGLLHTTSAVLLDRQGPRRIQEAIKEGIESQDDNRVADLHLWSIGPNIYAVELTVVTHDPQPPDHYKQMLPKGMGLAHVSLEVHRCVHEDQLDEAHRPMAAPEPPADLLQRTGGEKGPNVRPADP